MTNFSFNFARASSWSLPTRCSHLGAFLSPSSSIVTGKDTDPLPGGRSKGMIIELPETHSHQQHPTTTWPCYAAAAAPLQRRSLPTHHSTALGLHCSCSTPPRQQTAVAAAASQAVADGEHADDAVGVAGEQGAAVCGPCDGHAVRHDGLLAVCLGELCGHEDNMKV